MNEFGTTEELLNFAMEREQEAHDFYTGLAQGMQKPWMRKVFEGFAAEELGHKAKLERMKAGETPITVREKVQDLKMADYLVDVTPDEDMDYQDALVLAMKKEKAAFRLYMDLSELVEEEELKTVLVTMAQEEAKHKLRFEVEYDDNFMDSKY